jgi:arabinose-5-phosphate isomerase
MKEAIATMSEGRLGNVLITDKTGVLKAILSDGDVRRALLSEDFSLNHLAIGYAGKNPKIIDDKNTLASDALKIVEQYKIQILAITDKDKKIEGVLHIHHLIEAGIK